MYHHVTPKSYLGAFADNTNRVWVVEAGEVKRHPRSVRRVGGEENFYAEALADGTLDHSVELNVLQHTDRIGAELLTKLRGGNLLNTDEERSTFGSYVALQITRSFPQRHASEWMRNRASGVRGPREAEDSLRMLKPVVPLGNVLTNMRWRLLTFEKPALFTSDNPVCCWSRDRLVHGGNTPMTADEVRYPLSPTVALVMCWSDAPRDEIVLGDRVACARLGWSTAANAWRQVYCPTELTYSAESDRRARGPLFEDTARGASKRFDLVMGEVLDRRDSPYGEVDEPFIIELASDAHGT